MIIIIVYEDLGKTMECPKIYCTHFNRYAKFQSSCCSYQQWLILPKINCFRWWNSGFSRIWKLCGQVQTGTHHNPRKCGKCNQNSKQCSLDFSIAKGSTGNFVSTEDRITSSFDTSIDQNSWRQTLLIVRQFLTLN